MVRGAEHKPPIHKEGEEEKTIDHIDLPYISKKYNLTNPMAKIYYLDRIGEEANL